MKKWSLFLLAASVFLCMTAGSSIAVTFSGTASGEFVNEYVIYSTNIYSITNNDNGDKAYFNWGEPSATPYDSQFTFDGVGSDQEPGWTANAEESFLIGDFTYRNGSTHHSGGVLGIDLSITLQLLDPLYLTDSYTFNFSIENTQNIYTYADYPELTQEERNALNGDIVHAESAFSDTVFTYDDIDFTLELLGFSTDGGETIRTDFSSPERNSAIAGVYARITSDIPSTEPVPEPSTIFLMGFGVICLSVIIRKKQRKNLPE